MYLPRKKLKPDYDPQQMMADLLKAVTEEFEITDNGKLPTLSQIGDIFGVDLMKARKLLISAGVYQSETAEKINALVQQGASIKEIMSKTRLAQASVYSYLPYSHTTYKNAIRSVNADRIFKYRERASAIKNLNTALEQYSVESQTIDETILKSLWDAMILFEGYPFATMQGLKFKYTIKGDEIAVTKKEKSITKTTVQLALQAALQQERTIVDPKKLGSFGASYLYPIFIRLGVITKAQTT